MERLFKCSAGIDVHKKVAVCTVLKQDPEDETKIISKTKEYRTFSVELRELSKWLKTEKVEIVVMESTSVYWMPIYEACEDVELNVMVVNAHHVKRVPGKKTDVQDSYWLAELAMCGLLNKSFIPSKDMREIRVVSRYRRKVIQNLASEKNRLGKYLDASGIRIGSVVSRIDGVSAQLIIDHLLDKGELSLDDLTRYTKGKLREKKEDLLLALDGRLTDRHKIVLKGIRDHIRYLETLRDNLGEVVAKGMLPYKKEWEVLQTIPGTDTHSAAALLAEIGVEMSNFKNSKHISSWAGVCPGNNESAGKKNRRARLKAMST